MAIFLPFRTIAGLAAVALAATIAVTAKPAAARDSAPVATVGDHTITADDVKQAAADFAQELAQVPASGGSRS